MNVSRDRVTAIVLAGGRSSRFGGPKLAAELDGMPILDHAARAVAGVAVEVVLAGAQATALPSVPGSQVRLVVDAEPFAGPLAALDGALRMVDTELAIVVGGDMPGLVPAVLDAMIRRLGSGPEIDAVVLHDGAQRQVLPVALRAGPARVGTAAALRSGDRSLIRFLERLRCVELPASEWHALDPARRTVLDVDSPDDLERLRGRQSH